jgi:long-chain fatty acid transport protein
MLTRRNWLLATLVLATGAPVFAQSTAQFPVQFDFQNPGARSLAMGGAFIGAADDATAGFTNPAGLAFYGRRELAIEGRYQSLTTPFLAGGRISGVVSGFGLDTSPNAIYKNDVDRYFGPTYLSAMRPFGLRFTAIVFRHEVATLSNQFQSSGVFQQVSFFGALEPNAREIPIGGTRSIRIRHYGMAIGYRLHDRLALGLGVAVAKLKLASDFERYGVESDAFSRPNLTLSSATATQRSNDTASSFNTGLLWRPSDRLTAGLSYRRGAEFNMRQHDRVPGESFDVTRQGIFKVPDVYGAGVMWRLWPATPKKGDSRSVSTNSVRLLVDYTRVRYSQLLRDFATIQALASGRPERLRLDDANEAHVGLEFQWLEHRGKYRRWPLALRAGAWIDPDHTIRYDPTAARDEVDVFYSAVLPGGKSRMHLAFGGGVRLMQAFTLNIGIDRSRQAQRATATLSVNF